MAQQVESMLLNSGPEYHLTTADCDPQIKNKLKIRVKYFWCPCLNTSR